VFAGESFAVRPNRKTFTFLREKLLRLAVLNKLLRLTIFKRYFSKYFRYFLQIKGVIMIKSKEKLLFS